MDALIKTNLTATTSVDFVEMFVMSASPGVRALANSLSCRLVQVSGLWQTVCHVGWSRRQGPDEQFVMSAGPGVRVMTSSLSCRLVQASASDEQFVDRLVPVSGF